MTGASLLSIAYYIYTGVFEHHPNAIFASWARFAKRFFLFRVAPPQAAKKKMPGQFRVSKLLKLAGWRSSFRAHVGNWLASPRPPVSNTHTLTVSRSPNVNTVRYELLAAQAPGTWGWGYQGLHRYLAVVRGGRCAGERRRGGRCAGLWGELRCWRSAKGAGASMKSTNATEVMSIAAKHTWGVALQLRAVFASRGAPFRIHARRVRTCAHQAC